MDSPGAPSSSRLSPFKTYREFVADQRDDADPQAFARRYGEYRGGFARELVRRFFERNADFAWFRDRYDPSRVEERCEKQRARAAGAAKRFREDVDKAGEDAVKQASLDPNAIETVAPTDEDEDKVPLEASLHAEVEPGLEGGEAEAAARVQGRRRVDPRRRRQARLQAHRPADCRGLRLHQVYRPGRAALRARAHQQEEQASGRHAVQHTRCLPRWPGCELCRD